MPMTPFYEEDPGVRQRYRDRFGGSMPPFMLWNGGIDELDR